MQSSPPTAVKVARFGAGLVAETTGFGARCVSIGAGLVADFSAAGFGAGLGAGLGARLCRGLGRGLGAVFGTALGSVMGVEPMSVWGREDAATGCCTGAGGN